MSAPAEPLQPRAPRLRVRGRRRSVILVALFALGATVLGSHLSSVWWSQGGGPKYRLARVERGSLTAVVTTSGTLNPVMSIQVGSQVSGRLKEILVDFNTVVKKNDLMARIDPEGFEAKVKQAEAQLQAAEAAVLNQAALVERSRAELANARATLSATNAQIADMQAQALEMKRQLDRRTQLLQKELIAPSEMESAKAAFDSAGAKLQAAQAQAAAQAESIRAAEAQLKVTEAQLQAARAQVAEKDAALGQVRVDLANTRIVAPVDGVVVARHVDVGETMAATLQSPLLFTIAQDLTKMQVNANVDEADIGQVKVGQKATFTVDAFRAQTFVGEVTQIRKAAQVVQSVVSYVVVVAVRNPELKLLPGMTASVRIVVDTKDRVLKVPVAALRFSPAEPATREPSGSAAATEPRTSAPDRPDGSGAAGRIWILNAVNQPQPVAVRLGHSDGTFTELLGGNVVEGQEVVVGVSEAASGDAPGGRRQKSPRLI